MSVITQRPGKSGDGEDSFVTPKSFNSSPINTATKIPFANSNSSPIIPKNYKPLKTGSSSSTSVRKQSQPISDNSDKMKELTDWGFDIAQKIVDYLFSPSGKELSKFDLFQDSIFEWIFESKIGRVFIFFAKWGMNCLGFIMMFVVCGMVLGIGGVSLLKLVFMFSPHQRFSSTYARLLAGGASQTTSIETDFGRNPNNVITAENFEFYTSHTLMFYLNLIGGLWVMYNIMFNYCYVIFKHPGSIPSEWMEEKMQEREHMIRVKKIQTQIRILQRNPSPQNLEVLKNIMKIVKQQNNKGSVVNQNEDDQTLKNVSTNDEHFDETKLMEEEIELPETSQNVLSAVQNMITSNSDMQDHQNQSMEDESENKTVLGKKWSKFCARCQKPKPKRSHHCHICDKCITRMDHHCPWINNCVGYQNHRFFWMFLIYTGIGCAWLTLFSVGGWIGLFEVDPIEWHRWEGAFTFIGVLCATMGCAVAGFAVWHGYLIFSNQTTIEFQFNKMRDLDFFGELADQLQRKPKIDVFRGRKKKDEKANIYDIGIKKNGTYTFGVPFPETKFLTNFFPEGDSIPKTIVQEIAGWAAFLFLIALPIDRKLPSNGVEWPTNTPSGFEESAEKV